jgi:hypothetical protein
MGRIWGWCRAFFVKSINFCGSFFGTGFVGDGTQHPAHSTAQRISFFFGYGDGLLIAKGREHTYGL